MVFSLREKKGKEMSSVLLDGEGLYESSFILDNIKNREIKFTEFDALMNTINGIVLWDEIFVMEETFNSHWMDGVKYFSQYNIPFKELYRASINRALERIELDHFFQYEEPKGILDELKPDERGVIWR